jgi:uncharacterized protein YecT (DUF1311 family)
MPTVRRPEARIRRFAVASVLAAFVVPVLAEVPVRCTRERSQLDLNACVAADRRQAEARLDAAVGAYRARLHEGDRARFDEVQRAWRQYRDASCAFETSGVEGGSAHPAVLAGCLAESDRERTRRVRALLACREGDLSCPALLPSNPPASPKAR